jgi:hypothetical protein
VHPLHLFPILPLVPPKFFQTLYPENHLEYRFAKYIMFPAVGIDVNQHTSLSSSNVLVSEIEIAFGTVVIAEKHSLVKECVT